MPKLIYSSESGFEVREASADEVPNASSLSAGEVLIKNVAVASNPKDWKIIRWKMFKGVDGNDIAGTIEAVASDVTDFKKGDRVLAFTPMAEHSKYGGYQTYTVAKAHTTAHLPDSLNFEDAATLPLAATTAFLGTFVNLGLPEPSSSGKPAANAADHTLVVWGIGTSVGSYVLQLATIAGFDVIGVAGSSAAFITDSLKFPKERIVDYRQDRAQIIEQINRIAGGKKVGYVYDAISEPETISTVIELLSTSPNTGGTITTVLPTQYDKKDSEARAELEKVKINLVRTMCGEVHTQQEKHEFGSRWLRTLATWSGNGLFKPNRVKLIDGGLEGVPKGLDLLEKNKVNAEKLVYRIADTP